MPYLLQPLFCRAAADGVKLSPGTGRSVRGPIQRNHRITKRADPPARIPRTCLRSRRHARSQSDHSTQSHHLVTVRTSSNLKVLVMQHPLTSPRDQVGTLVLGHLSDPETGAGTVIRTS